MTVAPARVEVPEAPPIPGLDFRRLRLPEDLPAIADLFNTCNAFDDVEDRNNVDRLEQWYATASGWDPAVDCFVAEVEGSVIGYGKVQWSQDTDGGRNYSTHGSIHPDWRRRGLGRAMYHANVHRLREIAAGQDLPSTVERRLEAWVMESQVGAIALLESEGFTVARTFFEMLRPNLETAVELPMPEGLEVRPMLPEHYRAVWNADAEAFADHWGGMDSSDQAFERYFSGPSFEPDIWRVAWDGEQVAGSVANIIMREYNAQTGSQRGILAGVSVRRAWRGRGLARALVSQSLIVLREHGMTEAVLGVDATNPTGALGVYEANGFAVHRRTDAGSTRGQVGDRLGIGARASF